MRWFRPEEDPVLPCPDWPSSRPCRRSLWTAAACCRLSEAALLPPLSLGTRIAQCRLIGDHQRRLRVPFHARRPTGWPPASGSRLPQSRSYMLFRVDRSGMNRSSTNIPDGPGRPSPNLSPDDVACVSREFLRGRGTGQHNPSPLPTTPDIESERLQGRGLG